MRPARASICRGLGALMIVGVGASRSSAQTTPPLDRVRIALSSGTSSLPALYAIQEGLFRSAGLDVSRVPGATSGAIVSAGLLGGSIDIGMSNLFPLIEAHARGIPLVVVAPATLHVRSAPSSGVLVPANSTIRSVKDLNGKTVAVSSLEGLDAIGISNMIDASGGDSKTVHFVELPFPATFVALEQGRVDAGSLVEPFLSEAVRSGKARFLGDFVGFLGSAVSDTTFITTIDFIKNHRSAAERFKRVIEQANRYVNAHYDQLIGLAASYTRLDPKLIAQSTPNTNATTLDPRTMQPVIDLVAKYGLIPKAFPAREIIGLP